MSIIIIIIMTRSDQPKPPAVAIVRQNGLSSASSRASVAVTPVSQQMWWTQVLDGRPQVRLHSCEGRSPSLVLVQIRKIRFAGTSLRSLATWPKRPSLRLRTMYETLNRLVWCKTSSLDTKSCHLMCRMHRWQRILLTSMTTRNSELDARHQVLYATALKVDVFSTFYSTQPQTLTLWPQKRKRSHLSKNASVL